MKTYPIEDVIKKYLPRCKFGITTLKYLICNIHDQRVCNFNRIKFLTEDKIKALDECFNTFDNVGMTTVMFGYQEFWGDIYHYSPVVFTPKLTTETLVKQVVTKSNINQNSNILDLCTGSGCVAISVTKETGCNADACDLDENVINIAKDNCSRLGGNVNFFTMNILEEWKLDKKYDVIVSNPPYWPKKEMDVNKNIVSSSSSTHFYGGDDGLLFIRTIINNAPKHLTKDGMLFIEFFEDQKEDVKKLLQKDFKDIRFYKDWHHNPKVVAARLK